MLWSLERLISPRTVIMKLFVRNVALALFGLATLLMPGCANPNATFIGPLNSPDVDTPIPGWGLRKLDPKDYPDMKLAWMDKEGLSQAIGKSLAFLATPSSQRWYPSRNPGDTITHDQVQATLIDIQDMLRRNVSPEEFQQTIVSRYDVYTSVGYDDKGDVWYTGYFTPHYYGSLFRTSEFKYPIYKRPPDLSSDPITGQVIGSYPTRRELMSTGRLQGLELLWFKKPLEPFMIQVQGSAQVELPDGGKLMVGYAGSNGREHKGLGAQLRDEGKLDARHLSLPAVIAYFDAHPGELDRYILNDDRFTFQMIYNSEADIREWPKGSLNVQVTDNRSIATDKDIFPRASLTFVDVPKTTASGGTRPFGLMLDQDTGGGIRAAGRADLYMGFGDAAGARAGDEFAQGHLYYFFLKPEFVRPAAVAGAGAARTAAPRTVASPIRTSTSTPQIPTPTRAATSEMFPGAVRPN
jgi:membrane-bound lytic murein transglycosylase A